MLTPYGFYQVNNWLEAFVKFLICNVFDVYM